MTAFQNAAGVGQAAKRQDMPTMAMEHSMRIFYHIPRKHARPTAKILQSRHIRRDLSTTEYTEYTEFLLSRVERAEKCRIRDMRT
jgi:hypothetical protein